MSDSDTNDLREEITELRKELEGIRECAYASLQQCRILHESLDKVVDDTNGNMANLLERLSVNQELMERDRKQQMVLRMQNDSDRRRTDSKIADVVTTSQTIKAQTDKLELQVRQIQKALYEETLGLKGMIEAVQMANIRRASGRFGG